LVIVWQLGRYEQLYREPAMAQKKVKVGIVGFGTVGAGVARILTENADAIETKMGVRLELARVVDLDTKSPRPVRLPDGVLTSDLNALLEDKSIEIGVELVGETIDVFADCDIQACGQSVVAAVIS